MDWNLITAVGTAAIAIGSAVGWAMRFHTQTMKEIYARIAKSEEECNAKFLRNRL